MTNTKNESATEVVDPERCRRWSFQDKLQMVHENYESGNLVSIGAWHHAVKPNSLFQWRKLLQGGTLSAVLAGKAVVLAFEPGEQAARAPRPDLLSQAQRGRASLSAARGLAAGLHPI